MTQSLIYDPNAGGDVAANVVIADDGLYVFNAGGRRLQHWPYEEIAHAFPAGEGMNHVLVRHGRPEIRLNVAEGAVYDGIARRAPQLRPRSLLSFAKIWSGVPDEAQMVIVIAIFALPVLLYYSVTSWFD